MNYAVCHVYAFCLYYCIESNYKLDRKGNIIFNRFKELKLNTENFKTITLSPMVLFSEEEWNGTDKGTIWKALTQNTDDEKKRELVQTT